MITTRRIILAGILAVLAVALAKALLVPVMNVFGHLPIQGPTNPSSNFIEEIIWGNKVPAEYSQAKERVKQGAYIVSNILFGVAFVALALILARWWMEVRRKPEID